MWTGVHGIMQIGVTAVALLLFAYVLARVVSVAVTRSLREHIDWLEARKHKGERNGLQVQKDGSDV